MRDDEFYDGVIARLNQSIEALTEAKRRLENENRRTKLFLGLMSLVCIIVSAMLLGSIR
jgi:hypothetical protein